MKVTLSNGQEAEAFCIKKIEVNTTFVETWMVKGQKRQCYSDNRRKLTARREAPFSIELDGEEVFVIFHKED